MLQLEEFQVQLAHLKMRFSAAGIFPLDYSQLQKVRTHEQGGARHRGAQVFYRTRRREYREQTVLSGRDSARSGARRCCEPACFVQEGEKWSHIF